MRSRCRTRKAVARALREACALPAGTTTMEAAWRVMRALDRDGYIIMAVQPHPNALHAADAAMRSTGYIPGTEHQRQHTKHAIRFAAMVQAERLRSGLATADGAEAGSRKDATGAQGASHDADHH